MKILYKILFIFFISNSAYTLDIEEVIKSTIENNPKVNIAKEKIKESKELLIFSKGYKLPTISTSISGTYLNSETKINNIKTTPETITDLYKLTIKQNLYDAGFNDLEIERSKILYNSELINFQITIQDLILDAIDGYLTVINYKKSLESTQKNYDSVFKAYEETKTRFDLGSATLYDLQNAEASFATSETNLFAAKQNVIISEKIFKRIANLEPNNLEDILNIEKLNDLETLTNNSLENNLGLLLISNDIKNIDILILKEKKLRCLI